MTDITTATRWTKTSRPPYGTAVRILRHDLGHLRGTHDEERTGYYRSDGTVEYDAPTQARCAYRHSGAHWHVLAPYGEAIPEPTMPQWLKGHGSPPAGTPVRIVDHEDVAMINRVGVATGKGRRVEVDGVVTNAKHLIQTSEVRRWRAGQPLPVGVRVRVVSHVFGSNVGRVGTAISSETIRLDATATRSTAEMRRWTEVDEVIKTPANPALDALWKALGEEANRQNLCSEYDEFARKHGGPPRPTRTREEIVTVRVTVPENQNIIATRECVLSALTDASILATIPDPSPF